MPASRTSFHSFRDGNAAERNALWAFHDRHPFPTALNRLARETLVYRARRLAERWLAAREHRAARRTGRDPFGDPVASRRELAEPIRTVADPPVDRVANAFEALHAFNEEHRTEAGAWLPQRYANYAGRGVPIENVALTAIGYLAAYRGTGKPEYLERAIHAGDYLLSERFCPDGHWWLQGHTVIDITYAYAGLALLHLHRETGEARHLSAAERTGDRLVEYQIAGSINHGAAPCWLLGPLYRRTGNPRYLANAVKRIRRTALRYHLASGAWGGHESWTWYHAITLRGLVETYVAAPFTLEHQGVKDRMAECITAALNRLVHAQRADGSLRPGRGDSAYTENDEFGTAPSDSFIHFRGPNRLQRAHGVPFEHYGYELEALIRAHEALSLPALLPLIDGLADALARRDVLWRAEFSTFALGRYLELARERAAAPRAVSPL